MLVAFNCWPVSIPFQSIISSRAIYKTSHNANKKVLQVDDKYLVIKGTAKLIYKIDKFHAVDV